MKQLFRFIFIAAALCWMFLEFLGIGIAINTPGNSILHTIVIIIFVMFVTIVLFLAARWCNKGSAFDIKKDSLYVLKNMGICCLIYLGVGLIGRLFYVFKVVK